MIDYDNTIGYNEKLAIISRLSQQLLTQKYAHELSMPLFRKKCNPDWAKYHPALKKTEDEFIKINGLHSKRSLHLYFPHPNIEHPVSCLSNSQ